MKQKINFLLNGKRKIGVRDLNTNRVLTSDGVTRNFNECSGVIEYETYGKGKLIKPKKIILKK